MFRRQCLPSIYQVSFMHIVSPAPYDADYITVSPHKLTVRVTDSDKEAGTFHAASTIPPDLLHLNVTRP